MKKLLLFSFCLSLGLGQMARAAEGACQPFPGVAGDPLVALVSGAGANAVLRIDYDSRQVCTVGDDSLDGEAATDFHVNIAQDELAIRAVVEGYQTWLRVDTDYDGELLLDRATAEGLDLTAAEFLGDNSQLEAADFFVEFVGSLELGAKVFRNVETNIPLLEVPYDHYMNRGPKPGASAPEAEFLTVGSLGEAILEEVIIILDIAKRQLVVTDAE